MHRRISQAWQSSGVTARIGTSRPPTSRLGTSRLTMKLHAYQTADAMADECFVLETGKNLVAIESPPFDVNVAEWKQYIGTLGKPLTDVLISAHPGGGKWYGDAK